MITQKIVTDKGDGVTTQVGDISQLRNENWILEQDASDPRLAGTFETWINSDKRPDGSAEMWDKGVLTNDAGSWEGTWIGTIAIGGLTHYILGIYEGKGACEGLLNHIQYHFAEAGEGFSSDIVMVGSGWIEPKK